MKAFFNEDNEEIVKAADGIAALQEGVKRIRKA